MLLVIDAGNTNITLGVFEEERLLKQWRLVTDRVREDDEYGAQIRTLFDLAHLDHKAVQAIAVACVVPEMNFTFTRMARKYFDLTPLFVDYSTDTGLKIHYDPPSDLGADRIVDAVAAIAKYGAPCIVVDFGTATTFNAINSAGEFLGGAICPGLTTSGNALFARAPKLPRVEFEPVNKAIGQSTVEALKSGLYFGYVGLVDRLIEAIKEGMGGSPTVIATGGLAPLMEHASAYIDQLDQTLTLDGLHLVYERVTGKRDD
jgi:type III pantothenate kinase